jgi:hypothetical protein
MPFRNFPWDHTELQQKYSKNVEDNAEDIEKSA